MSASEFYTFEKANPITDFNREFLEFAKAKPPEESYDVGNIDDCALAQFAKSRGYVVSNASYRETPTAYGHFYPDAAFNAAVGVANVPARAGLSLAPNWGDLVKRLTWLLAYP